MMWSMQRGFVLVSAIFILVVLAMLGAFAAGISGAQHLGSAQDLQSARAYQAARAGLEWGLYQVNIANAAAKVAGTACPAASTNLTLPAGSTLSNMTVTVSCAWGGAALYGVYRLSAVACNQPNAAGACPNTTAPSELYVEREVEMYVQGWN